jgi:two-component sensor histidine kinase
VVLVASELVTNAVRHSGCDPSDEIELQIDQASDGVVITVRDVGRSPSEPSARAADIAPGGLGLRLVEMLCTRWGTGAVDGRLVWAHIAC